MEWREVRVLRLVVVEAGVAGVVAGGGVRRARSSAGVRVSDGGTIVVDRRCGETGGAAVGLKSSSSDAIKMKCSWSMLLS